MKPAFAMIAALGMLAGCTPALTLEQARAACAKQGGLLVVIHTQKLTSAGLGDPVDTPGDCVSPGKFGASQPARPAN